MNKTRLEAFSDGVLAIIITIMVLELKVPHGKEWQDLYPLCSKMLSYILSFTYVGIYWNNHHHLFHTVKHVSAGILWANLHLLFWLSLLPFATAWAGENNFSQFPIILYGVLLFMCAIAYFILSKVIIAEHGEHSLLAKAVGKIDLKGILSPVIYAVGVALAFYLPLISFILYFVVAIMWIIPDRRIEKVL